MVLWFQRWVWQDIGRRSRNLLCFAVTEADGGRDLVRAAELTPDPILRRLYLVHAIDELRHAELLRCRGAALRRAQPACTSATSQSDWFARGERGLDDLRVADGDDRLLAFLHLAEKAAHGTFQGYRNALPDDRPTRELFQELLRDEAFHMSYTLAQLKRISPRYHRILLWRARAGRLWKAYLRLAAKFGGVMGTLILTIQYFVLLPPFAVLAKRALRRERRGWSVISPTRMGSLNRQY